MREIKFRGKKKDSNTWAYGFLSFHYVEGKNKNGFILSGNSQIYDAENCKTHVVLTETIGQYTGLKDRDGKEIYEGDFLKDDDYNGLVIFSNYYLGFFVQFEDDVELEPLYDMQIAKVIGNIHENPELNK